MPARQRTREHPMSSSTLYSYYLKPACYTAVAARTRKKLARGEDIPLWTMMHILTRMRKQSGCNVPGGRTNNNNNNNNSPRPRRKKTARSGRANVNNNNEVRRLLSNANRENNLLERVARMQGNRTNAPGRTRKYSKSAPEFIDLNSNNENTYLRRNLTTSHNAVVRKFLQDDINRATRGFTENNHRNNLLNRLLSERMQENNHSNNFLNRLLSERMQENNQSNNLLNRLLSERMQENNHRKNLRGQGR